MRPRLVRQFSHSSRLIPMVLAACGSGQLTVHSTTQVQQSVVVVSGESGQGEAEIDFEDPRLLAALADTERIVGRRVDIAFDLSRMPRPRGPFFEAMFDRQIGRLPRALLALSQGYPERFEFLKQTMNQVSFDYDGAQRDTAVEYDRETGVLRYTLSSHQLGREGVLYLAADEAYRDMLDDRFASKPLAEIGTEEMGLYASWVSIRRRRNEDVLLRLSEFLLAWNRALGEDSLRTELMPLLRREIAGRASVLAEQYSGGVQRSVSPLLEEVDRNFAQFVMSEFDALEPRGQGEIVQALFARRRNAAQGEDLFARDAFPGLDRYQFGMRIVRVWLRAGAGATLGEGSGQRAMTNFICPRGHGERPLDGWRCHPSGGFWHFISYDETLRARLAATLAEVDDPRLTVTALAGVLDTNAQAMVDVWHRLENSPAHWLIGARVLGDRRSYDRNRELLRTLYDEAVGAWRNPAIRAGYLYVIAAHEYPRSARSGIVPFGNFRGTFGAPIDRDLLREFLKVGEGAVLRLSVLWPALSPRAGDALVVPALTQLLDDGPNILRRSGFQSADVVGDWLRAMRRAGDRAAQHQARRYLMTRLRRRPSERRRLETLIALTR